MDLLRGIKFPALSESVLRKRLSQRDHKIRIVLDTDTFNETDDQFALVYAMLSPLQFQVEAIYAAPYHNKRSDSPGHGMELSYQEIKNILQMLGHTTEHFVFRGSTNYLGPDFQPHSNDAVRDLVDRALDSSPDDPLYVVAIGAITNIASALLIEPRIVEKLVVVWLGGHALTWPDTKEFNLRQDVPAAQILLGCGVPLVLVPCKGVTSHLSTTLPEIERYVEPHGQIGSFLSKRFQDPPMRGRKGRSRVLWDMAPIGYLINPNWVPTELVSSPFITDEVTWGADSSRHLIRCAVYVHRDHILTDMFQKLEGTNDTTKALPKYSTIQAFP